MHSISTSNNNPSNGDDNNIINNNVSRFPMNLLTLFPDSEQEREWQGPFSFVHACDPQLGLIEKHILKKEEPGWEVDLAHLKCMIKMVNEIVPKPKFLVIGGDMVDTPPYDESLALHTSQFNDFKECCCTLLDPDIKLLFVCGNHDVGDMPTFSTMQLYRDEFGPEYFSFWQGGVKFTILNSQYFKFPELLEMEYFQQMDFLLNSKNTDDNIAVHHVIFQHIPLCLECEDEIDISFLNINKPTRKELLDVLIRVGVKHIFYGHTHRNGISRVRSIEQVLTAAVGGTFDDTKSGFRLVYVSENGISHEYIPLEMQFKELNEEENNDMDEDMDAALLLKALQL